MEEVSSVPTDVNEKGEPYVTPVVEHTSCRVCGVEIPQRAEGRARIYCGPTCRQRAARSTPKLF